MWENNCALESEQSNLLQMSSDFIDQRPTVGRDSAAATFQSVESGQLILFNNNDTLWL